MIHTTIKKTHKLSQYQDSKDNKTWVWSVQLGKALSRVSSGSLQVPNKYWAQNKFLVQKELWFQRNFGSRNYWVENIPGLKKY